MFSNMPSLEFWYILVVMGGVLILRTKPNCQRIKNKFFFFFYVSGIILWPLFFHYTFLQCLFNENQHHYEYTHLIFFLTKHLYRRLFTILHALHIDGVDNLIEFIQASHVLAFIEPSSPFSYSFSLFRSRCRIPIIAASSRLGSPLLHDSSSSSLLFSSNARELI